MTSTTTDHIEEIKNAEQKAKKLIEEKSDELKKQEENFKKLLKDKKDHELTEIKKKGITQLEAAKQEADSIKKNIVSEAESRVSSLTSQAESKEKDALNFIEATFIEQIKA